MVLIPKYFSANQNVEICICRKVEDITNLYMCEYWNDGEISENSFYEDSFSDTIKEQIKVNKQFMVNCERREIQENEEQK